MNDRLGIWAHVERELRAARDGVLKENGLRWDTYHQLKEEIETLPPGDYQTDSGTVRVEEIQIIVHGKKNVSLGMRHKARLLTEDK